MKFNIISTGSKGNAVVVSNTILIDCGVSFKALQPYYKNIVLVLLTHIHCDHFNKKTIKKLAKERPMLRWVCPLHLLDNLLSCEVKSSNIDIIINYNEILKYAEFSIKAFGTVHNVPSCGYKIHFSNEKVFYATDLNTLQGINAQNYDLYMIESNYNQQEILERIKQKQEKGEFCHEWKVLENHLSDEKATEWLYANMGNRSSYVFLHGHTTI